MKYLEPSTIEQALDSLCRDEDARCLAGGATLVAMLNADLISPSVLIGLRRIGELRGIEETGAGIRIGAMTTHAAVAADERLKGAMAVVRHAAGQIAHPAIRNQGTIGGSLCHADPSADLPGALVAAGAAVEAVGRAGRRRIPIADFFADYFETSLARDEIMHSVFVPKGPAGACGHHLKFSRVEGDYATVSISLVLAMDGGACSHARIAVGSVGPKPLHLDSADALLQGSRLTDQDIARAGELLAQASNPVDDVRGSSAYRRMLIPRLLGRAVKLALENPHD